MLIVNVKESGNLEKALKNYKWKVRKSGLIKDIRENKQYTKKSDKRRVQLQKAKYKQRKFKHIK